MNTFTHECPDWDFQEINLATDGEAVGCTCFHGNAEADAMKERAALELDAANASLDAQRADVG